MTEPEELQSYLHENIPIADAMGVRVLAASDDEVRLWAPLDPNVNHHMTAFGGSVASVGILAGWVWLKRRLANHEPGQLVIHRATIDYHEPIAEDFTFVCSGADLTSFFSNYDRRGVARVELTAEAIVGVRVAARATGIFVAKRSPQPI